MFWEDCFSCFLYCDEVSSDLHIIRTFINYRRIENHTTDPLFIINNHNDSRKS